MARMSVATIDKPEFINITPCNPLISQCEIKVMYVGENRNKSYITKEVATEMANTLPGCPIVGYYKEDKKDFSDHGDRVVIDDEGFHFQCMTRPYGFVAPDAKVWFQKFEDTDEFGIKVIREYLMTTGYLWTGQYPECRSVVDSGKPHSMELDEETLDGKWTKNYNTGMDFFIINDAVFSKLCVLGDDVEPCFEGSSVTAPRVSAAFSKADDAFKKTLFSMMQELKFALKGEQQEMISNIENFDSTQDNLEQDITVENQNFTEDSAQSTFAASDDKKEEEKKEKQSSEDEAKTDSESKEDEEDKKKYAKSDDEDEKEDEDKEEKPEQEDKKEEDEDKKKFSLLEQNYQTLQSDYSALEAKYNELLAFKNQIEDEKKDALIDSFYMLSAEDKKDIIENKSKYSLDDIEKELSVICVRKKVNFDLDDNSENDNKEESSITTFNLNEQVDGVAPAWINALRNTQKSRNI